MRGHGPLHEGHLAEAVRRGLITDEQREAILAMARSEAIDASVNVPDLRWTVVVQATAAALAVLIPGATILVQADASASEPILLVSTAFAAMLFGALGWVARERAWGRSTAAIFSAAVAPYTGGVAMFALDLAWNGVFGRGRIDRMISGELTHGEYWRSIAVLFLVGSLVSTATAWGVSKARANGPVWSLVGAALAPVAYAIFWLIVRTGEMPVELRNIALGAAVTVGVALSRLGRSGLRRGGVDGASWFELGVFAPLLWTLVARLYDSGEGVGAWLAISAAIAAAGVRARRWTYKLVGALSMVLTALVGLRHESVVTRGAGVVAVVAVLGVAAQVIRRREADRGLREAPGEALAYWE